MDALDAPTAEDRGKVDRWFAQAGPLGEIPRGDNAVLSPPPGLGAVPWPAATPMPCSWKTMCGCRKWRARCWPAMAGFPPMPLVVKLEHYGPPGQRVLLEGMRRIGEDFQMGRMLSRHTGAAAYILSRRAARAAACAKPASTCRWIIYCSIPTIPNCSPRLSPWQLVPPIARQARICRRKIRHRKHPQGPARFQLDVCQAGAGALRL